MSYHESEHERFRASVTRHKNAQFQPDTFGFDDFEVLRAVHRALGEALESRGSKMVVKRGLAEDGRPEAWILVKRSDELLYVGNVSYTCPPRPPEDCLE